jgi:IclR family pca regulon transcriptional regulator
VHKINLDKKRRYATMEENFPYMKQSSKYETNLRLTNYLANSNIKELLILECFTPSRPRLSQSEIQKITNISKSTICRLVRALTELGYLKYDSESKKYYLGPRVLSLGFSVLQSMEVREIARPYLERLSRECNKSVNLLMLDRDEMVFIERIRVPGPRDYNISIGSRIPIYNTAAGKAVLAYLDRERLEQIINEIKKDDEIAQNIGENGRILITSLNKVRREKYAINDEESQKGVRAIGVPVFSSEGVAYAMDLVVPSEEISINELRSIYAPKMIKMGKEISEAMGYQGK